MNHWLRNFALMALMLAASAGAVALRPTHKIAENGSKVDLEAMIPASFEGWREETQTSAQIVDPQQKKMLDEIYSQLLTRTYVNNQGYRIMLSIAYGTDQTDGLQVHKPENCYPAQGFVLEDRKKGVLDTGTGTIPVTRLLTTLGDRHEPVTYWTTIADQVVRSGTAKKLIELSYGLTGKIPDGMLVRISSIDTDTERAYAVQETFASQMLGALSPASRTHFTGHIQLN